MLALRCLRLHLVEWVVQDLSVVAAEFAHLSEVDIDHLTFIEKLTDHLEDVQKHGLEGSFVDLDVFSHGREVWSGHWLKDYTCEVCHLWLVLQLVHL